MISGDDRHGAWGAISGSKGYIFPSVSRALIPALRRRWIGIALAAVILAGMPCRAGAAEPELLVGCERDFKPYAFAGEDGRPAGFAVDLMQAVADAMGLRISIKLSTWDTAWNGLIKGNVDILPVVAKLPSRIPHVDFSIPHTETFDAFFVRTGKPLLRDIEAAKGKKIVVLRSDAAHHALLERNFAGKIIPVDTTEEMFSLIASGRHDALLYPKVIGILEVRERGLGRVLNAGPPIPDYKRVFSFAVKKGDVDLLEKLNQGLLIVKTNGEYDRIYEKWLTVDEPWRKYRRYVAPAAAFALAVFAVAVAWLVMLRSQVRKRTRELAEKNEMLRQAGDELEGRIVQRTAELSQVNADLQAEIREHNRAEEVLQETLRRFELLTVTANELLRSAEPQRAVEVVCRKVMEYLDCHAFFNFLADEQAGRLHMNACAGISEEEAKDIEWLDYGVAVCGCAARDGRRIVAEHIPTTADERTGLIKSYGIKAYCCHPLLGPGGRVIGTLSFGTCSRETFIEEDLSLMKAVSDQVAVAIIRMKDQAEVLKLSEAMAARNVELEAVNRELEAFIYSVSHDLRAPLRSIAGFSRMLAEDYAGRLAGQGEDFLSRIHSGSARMSRLIEDLLNLSRISRQEIIRTEIDMSTLASSIISDLRTSNPKRAVAVSIQRGIIAWGDRRLIGIVLTNLLGNAWKFTAKTENARIEFGMMQIKPPLGPLLNQGGEPAGTKNSPPDLGGVPACPVGRAEGRGGVTVYFVRDNGAGFAPDYAGKMFMPFERLHSEDEFEGTGIGLAIVERIIHRHGGRVWAEGEPCKGATVYFTLG